MPIRAQIPLPLDLRIEAPGLDVPAEVARFAGAWKDAGGSGVLAEFRDLPGSGHALIGWTETWTPTVARYLDGIEGRQADAAQPRE